MQQYMDSHQKISARNPGAHKDTCLPPVIRDRLAAASGLPFDDVRVHYNSEKPAALEAYAYTQTPDVYIAPGQERYLSHELGHVVQQKRGLVASTGTLNGIPINDDPALERAADTMTSDLTANASGALPTQNDSRHSTAQCHSRSSAVQRKPWHSDANFPWEKLDCDNLAPTTPMTGHTFIGYTYPAKDTLAAADQTGAISAAADFIGGLPTPEPNNIIGKSDIAGELKQRDATSSANGNATAAQDAKAFGDVDAILRGVTDQTPENIFKALDEHYQGYIISELVPPEISDSLIFYARLIKICSGKTDKDAVLGEISTVPNYDNEKIYNKKMRDKIRDSGSVQDIIDILTSKLASYRTIYDNHEKGARKGRGLGTRKTANRIDPFHVKVMTQYPGAAGANELNLHYQFSRESYGYIVEIQRNAETYRMQNNGTRDTVPPGQYVSAHDIADNVNPISAIAARATRAVDTEDPDTNTENAKYNNDIFDAITKLGGEGSRWKCVRAHAARLKNNSLFYTLQDQTYYYITFRNLWASWREFGLKYNIEDSTVAAKLRDPNSLDDLKEHAAAADFHPDPDKDYCLDPH